MTVGVRHGLVRHRHGERLGQSYITRFGWAFCLERCHRAKQPVLTAYTEGVSTSYWKVCNFVGMYCSGAHDFLHKQV